MGQQAFQRSILFRDPTREDLASVLAIIGKLSLGLETASRLAIISLVQEVIDVDPDSLHCLHQLLS